MDVAASNIKRVLTLFLIFATLFALAACGKEKPCEHHYESETVIEASYYSDGEIKKVCVFCNNETSEIIPKLDLPIEVSVTALETFEQTREPLVFPDGMEIFQPSIYWILFEMDVENLSEKDITGFSGTITIIDNDRKLNVYGSFDEMIVAGETVHLSNYGFQVSHTDLTLADNMLMGKTIENVEINFTLNDIKYN